MGEVVQRAAMLDRLVALIEGRAAGSRLRVAIDGPDAAGKTTLADELAELLQADGREVVRASIDGFHRSAEERHRRGAADPAHSYYFDSFDIGSVIECVLAPLAPDGDRRVCLRVFDHLRDRPIAPVWSQAPADAILVFDGVFLLRPELLADWDLTVHLHVPPEVTLARARARDAEVFGSVAEVERWYANRYLPGQVLYQDLVDPGSIADVVVDGSHPQYPAIERFPTG